MDKSTFPSRITLELTNRCNLSCTMCPRHHMKYPLGDMVPTLFRRLVDEMSGQGARTIVPFFRGEAVLHPQCVELLQYAKFKNLEIQLATNGSLVTNKTADALVDMEIDFISFSVDTIDELHYKKIRKGGRLPEILKGIDYFLNRKTKKKAHTIVQVSAVDTDVTAVDKESFIRFWLPKVNRVRIYPRHTHKGKFGSLGKKNMEKKRLVCRKPFTEMVIYWDGVVASCNHDWDRTAPLGDASKNSLQRIWDGSAYEQFRKRHQEMAFSSKEACASCDHWVPFDTQAQIIGELYENDA